LHRPADAALFALLLQHVIANESRTEAKSPRLVRQRLRRVDVSPLKLGAPGQ